MTRSLGLRPPQPLPWRRRRRSRTAVYARRPWFRRQGSCGRSQGGYRDRSESRGGRLEPANRRYRALRPTSCGEYRYGTATSLRRRALITILSRPALAAEQSFDPSILMCERSEPRRMTNVRPSRRALAARPQHEGGGALPYHSPLGCRARAGGHPVGTACDVKTAKGDGISAYADDDNGPTSSPPERDTTRRLL